MPERSVAPGGLGRRTKDVTMTTKLVALVLLCLMTGTAMAQQPKVTSLMSKDLTENPGREVLMITVEHAPGGSSPIHRHNAHAIVYVLEGSVVMQVKGGKQVTLTPGQTFYEGPEVYVTALSDPGRPTPLRPLLRSRHTRAHARHHQGTSRWKGGTRARLSRSNGIALPIGLGLCGERVQQVSGGRNVPPGKGHEVTGWSEYDPELRTVGFRG